MQSQAEILVDDAGTAGWFESLVCDISSRFINLPIDQLDAGLERVLRQLSQGLELDRATLWQKSPGQSGVLLLTHGYRTPAVRGLTEAADEMFVNNGGRGGRLHHAAGTVPMPYSHVDAKSYFPWTFERLKRGETVVVDSVEDLPSSARQDREFFLRYGMKSAVAVPLRMGADMLGCVSFACTQREKKWSKECVSRLELAAHLFTNALARKSAEAAMRENATRLQTILDTTVEGIATIDAQGRMESVNSRLEDLFGYEASEMIGRQIRMLMPAPLGQQHEEDLREHMRGEAKIIGLRRELIGKRKSGVVFPIELTVREATLGERRNVMAFVRDLTENKNAERSLRESETRFKDIADSAPVLIWMSDQDNQCVFFNKAWLDFTGRSLAEDSGQGWTTRIHPEDIPVWQQNCADSFDARRPFVVQFRLRRCDGAYRWLANSGVPRYGKDGQFCGYIGSCVDISERREAEEAARDLAGRVINAQEQERARLARDLHDDVTQRLARLAIDAGRIERAHSLDAQTEHLITGLREGLSQLSEDVHAISYELHPSAVIDLGLVEALRAECEQVSARAPIVAKMTVRNLPAAIPSDMAIGFFRIAQEALRNAVRHGRASRANVFLWGVDDGLQLVVEDDGVGFNPNERKKRPSLGLASMRERTRLLGGTLFIESKPHYGVTIVVWVPLTESAL